VLDINQCYFGEFFSVVFHGHLCFIYMSVMILTRDNIFEDSLPVFCVIWLTLSLIGSLVFAKLPRQYLLDYYNIIIVIKDGIKAGGIEHLIKWNDIERVEVLKRIPYWGKIRIHFNRRGKIHNFASRLLNGYNNKSYIDIPILIERKKTFIGLITKFAPENNPLRQFYEHE